MYCLSDHHSGLICYLSAYSNLFKYYIPLKLLLIGHLSLHGFINSNVINVGTLIYLLDDRFIPNISQFSHYRLNALFKLTKYFKILD